MSELKGIVHIDEYLYRVPLTVAEEIERLHIGYEAQEKQLHNACDEIERLTACVEHHQAVEADQQRAIERLQSELEVWKANAETNLGEVERLQQECARMASDHACLEIDNKRLRAALEAAHDVLANGGDLKTDTYQTRCNRALAITTEALRDE